MQPPNPHFTNRLIPPITAYSTMPVFAGAGRYVLICSRAAAAMNVCEE